MIERIRFLFKAGGKSGQVLLLYPLLLILVQRGRDLSNAAVVDSSALIQVIYVIISFFLVYLGQNNSNRNEVIVFINKSPLRNFIYFTFICLFSAFWSPNVYITIYRSIEVFIFTYIITSLAVKFSDNKVSAIQWLIYYAFFNLFVGILFRVKLEGLSTFRVPFLASRLFFPLFFFFIVFYSKKFVSQLLLFSVVIFGLSNKIFIGIALGYLTFMFVNKKKRVGLVVFLLMFLFLMVFGGLEQLLLSTLWYGRDSVGIEDASGRKLVWSTLWAAFLDRPLLGYGFVSGETELVGGIFKKGVINAHNTFISALVNVGLVGTLFLLKFYLEVAIRINQKLRGKLRVISLSTYVLLLTVLFAAPGIGGRVYGTWIPAMTLIVFMIAFTRERRFN